MTVGLDHLSLLHGLLPRFTLLLAGACGLATLARRDRHWSFQTLPGLVGFTAAVVAAAMVMVRVTHLVTDHYPPTFTIWVGMPVLALFAGVAGFRRARAWRRVAALVAIPLTVAAGFILINRHYAYWPTVGDLLGRPLPDRAIPARFAALHRRVGVVSADTTSPRHGRLLPFDVPGTASHFSARPGSVYLPPAFTAAGRSPLPVVVLVGGTPSAPDAWPRAGFAVDAADRYAAAHGGVAPILAFVDQNGSFAGDTECVDGRAGNAETFLAVDVPRFLSDRLDVPLDPRRWAIAGFSEGGTCALDLALRHPDVYGAFVDLAGDAAPNLGGPLPTLRQLYGGSAAAMAAHDPAELLRHWSGRPVVGWFGAGASDRNHVTIAERLAQEAVQVGLTARSFTLPGGHNWQFAAAAFQRVLPDLTETVLGEPE
jgi:S-formylglutathione hydrolase FrmB